jgi:hypothetical protein
LPRAELELGAPRERRIATGGDCHGKRLPLADKYRRSQGKADCHGGKLPRGELPRAELVLGAPGKGRLPRGELPREIWAFPGHLRFRESPLGKAVARDGHGG